MADVFVSYSRRDSGFVRELHAFLTGEGRDVWVDWEDIPPASEWQRDIAENVDGADSFVFVASASSLASDNCAVELRRAEEGGKRIVPLALADASPDDAPTALRHVNWIWCRSEADRKVAFEALNSALDTDLEWSRAHRRILVRATEWEARGDGSLLLRGKDLADAERVVAENAGEEPRPTELQQRFLLASRRAAARRQRSLLGGVSVALAVAVGLGVLALLQRNSAIGERNSARSVALASAGGSQLAEHLDVGLLLGLEANRTKSSVQARSSLISALEAAQESHVRAVVRTGAPVWAVALSRDGRMLATGGSDGSVRLWDLGTHRQLGRTLSSASGGVQSLAFSRDGATLAAGDEDSNVSLWNVGTRRAVGKPLTAPGAVKGLVFGPGDRTIAGVTDGRAVLWDLGTHEERGAPLRLDRTGDSPVDAAFSTDGRLLARTFLAGAPEFRSVRFGDGLRLGPARLGRAPQGWVAGSALGGDRTLSGLDDKGAVREWRLGTRRSSLIVPARYTGSVESFAVSPDGRTIAAGAQDGTVRLLGTRVERPATREGPAARYTYRVAFTRDGRAVSAGTTSGVRVGGSGGPPLADVDVGEVSDIALSPDGTLGVATARDRGLAEIWRLATGKVVRRLRVDADGVGAAAFSPHGNLVATGDESGTVKLWQVATGKGVALPDAMPSGIASVAFSPDGKLVAAGDGTGKTGLWKVAGHRYVGTLDTHVEDLGVTSVAFSPDSSRVATAGDDARLRVWDVGARQQLGPAIVNDTFENVEMTDVAFSPDGRTVATGDALEKVRLWDVDSHQQLGGPLTGSQLAFSPDGRSLLAAIFNGGTTRLWRGILWPDVADLGARVCNLVWGNLTKAEWAAYAPGLPPHATCG